MRNIFLYLLVGLVSAFIGYLGNELGNRFAKKRRSILGLRPRQTAILASTLMGALIGLVALTIILLVSNLLPISRSAI